MTTTECHVTHLAQRKQLTIVIRDRADLTKDYYLPEPRADALFERGELTLCELPDGRFAYVSPTGREVR